MEGSRSPSQPRFPLTVVPLRRPTAPSITRCTSGDTRHQETLAQRTPGEDARANLRPETLVMGTLGRAAHPAPAAAPPCSAGAEPRNATSIPPPVSGSCSCSPGAAYLQHIPNLTHHGGRPRMAITTRPGQDGSFPYGHIPPKHGQTAWGTPSCPMSPSQGSGAGSSPALTGFPCSWKAWLALGWGVPSAPPVRSLQKKRHPALPALHPALTEELHPHPSPQLHFGEESKGGRGAGFGKSEGD